MSKTPHDFVQDLEQLYQELLALRTRVRRAERANERRLGTKTRTGNPARRKQLAHKQSR